MQPSNPNSNTKSLKKLLIIIAVLLVIALVAWQIYLASIFRLVKTDPDLNNFPDTAVYVKLFFNRELKADSLSIVKNPIVTSQKVTGKVLTLNLTGIFETDKRYSIKINHISAVDGKEINNLSVNFVAKRIPYDKLSKDQQQAIIGQQDDFPYSVNSIDFKGFEDLLNYGLSSAQLDNLESAIFDFSTQQDKEFKTAALSDGTIKVLPHDRNSADTFNHASFRFVIDSKKTYDAKISYSGLSYCNLMVYTSGGKQIFDSAAGTD